MAVEIKVPRLGWNMEQGTFLGWLKRDGDAVQAGEPLFTLEGDKAVEEIEATESGILHRLANGPKEGEVVAVGAVLGHLTAAGEIVDAPPPGPPVPSSIVAAPPVAVPEAEPVAALPRRRAISPRARKAAANLGVDWTQLVGTGRNGRVRERDVLDRANRPAATVAPRVRQVIADRMMHSLRSTAPVTLTTTVDATNLVSLRNQFKVAHAGEAVVPSVTDFFVKLTARALQMHPHLNARWKDDQVVALPEIHIGLAVDTEAGLLVPVIRDVPRLSLQQVARRSRQLIEKARRRLLTAEDMRGGTFTITNLGPFDIDAFTPIIHWPECAILGVGRIHKQPAVVEDRVVPREMVTLSLTFDHRLVDGAPAARFLQTLGKAVENPGPWLIE
jgi:pyruvate dehydrogenase E2 component (dihydrolipoamide acetyltransferase)